MQCTENLKHIFPEMKLRGLVPSFYIHVSGSDLHIPTIGLIWNLYFPALCDRALSSTAGAERRAGGPAASRVGSSSTLPSAPVVESRLVHINDQHTNVQFGKLRLINGNT